MSSVHKDLHSWAAKARSQGRDTIEIDLDTADRAAEQIVDLSNRVMELEHQSRTTPARAEAQDEGAAGVRGKSRGQIAYEGWSQGLLVCEWAKQTRTLQRAWEKAAQAVIDAHPSPTAAADAACFECASDLWGPVCLNCNPEIKAVVERSRDQHGMAKILRDQLNDKSRRLNPGNMRPAADADRVRIAVEAITKAKDLDVNLLHVGYDSGPGGGNYVYADVVRTDELFPLLDEALAALKSEGKA